MTYTRLTDALAHCWDKPWSGLTVEQRDAWSLAFGHRGEPMMADGVYQPWQSPLFTWDNFAPNQRLSAAEQHDQQHDPACKSENTAWFDHFEAIREKEREIAEWESMRHQGIPSEAKTRHDELTRLRGELEVRKQAMPDAALAEKILDVVEAAEPEAESSASAQVGNWKLKVQAEAASLWKKLKEAGCNPTKNNIKDDLARWCRDQDVQTDRGINPSSEYISRHALRDWTPPKLGSPID